MESINFISSAQFIDRPLDTRRLSLSIYYYQFDSAQVISIISKLNQWLDDLTKQSFIYDCSYNGKRIKKRSVLDYLFKEDSLNKELRIAFDAYLTSPIIHDTVSLRKYQRYIQMLNPSIAFGWNTDPLLGSSSVDYPEYINNLFPSVRPEPTELIQLVSQLLCEPNKTCFALHNRADLSGVYTARPYKKHPGLYYGQLNFSVSAFSLGAALNDMANNMARLAEEIVNQYSKVNMFVSLQPPCSEGSPYMRYYGKRLIPDGSHESANCTEEEWYLSYHLRGVEWLNIVSPLARRHIKSISLENGKSDAIVVKELADGGLLVGSANPVTSYDTQTAYELKRIIQPALFPGMTSIPIRGLFPKLGTERIYDWCPRNDWAIIPIDENEISIVGENIVFSALYRE